MAAPNCADAIAEEPGCWPRDERGFSPCGACGQWMKPFRLVDVRRHLIAGLRDWSFLCDGCRSRLFRPRKSNLLAPRAMKKSVFVRGLPGSEATKRAHELRRAAADKPALEYLP